MNSQSRSPLRNARLALNKLISSSTALSRGLSMDSWSRLIRLRSPLALLLIFSGTVSWLAAIARQRSRKDASSRFPNIMQSSHSADKTDPPLLRKNSEVRGFRTHFGYYPSLRIFYRPHPHAEKMPNEPKPLPLLVFVHGLGGSLAQFNSLLSSMVNVAPCLGIDLPGCGRSGFAPKNWEAYSTEALVTLLDTIIETYRTSQEGQENRGVVLVSHSMGGSLCALLASDRSPHPATIRKHVQGLIAICPKADPPTMEQTKLFRKLLWIPGPFFDLFRAWDRRGGTESESVQRFVGPNSGIDVRKLQIRFNAQSKTPVWRRMAWGSLPTYNASGTVSGGMPGRDVWGGLKVPTYLIAGEADAVTKPEEVAIITAAMKGENPPKASGGSALPDASKVNDSMTQTSNGGDEKHGLDPVSNEEQETQSSVIMKSTILPPPAAHGLIYDHATFRTVAGLIQDFLKDYVSPHLSLGWQLQHLATSGKWDVKNLNKWQAVVPISQPIGPAQAPVFRALKTLRKQDEHHTPSEFVKEWNGKIFAIIDIGHDAPVYDPAELEAGGIQYHKFPTVSKIPPTVQEVQDFIALVERLNAQVKQGKNIANKAKEGETSVASDDSPVIAVHCHYGYNRTGFFIVCYLVEKLGYELEAAIEEFKHQRPPGIRHEHFIDTLYVRYTMGPRKIDDRTREETSAPSSPS